MKIRSKIALGGAIAIIAGSSLAVVPAAVSIAHVPEASASCAGVKVNAKDYEANKLNTVKVTVGDVVTEETFGKSYSKTFPVPQESATTSWKVQIAAENGSYGLEKSGTVGPCGVKTIVAPELGVAPPTCSDPGYFVPDFTLGTPAQNPNGWEGDGWRVYLNKPFVGVGEYDYVIQKQGAGFNSAYPNGTKVTGKLNGTLVVLPAIGFQTADPDAPCYNRPGVPEPTVKVTYSEWQDSEKDCVTKTVATERTEFTSVMTQVWDETVKAYVDTEPVVTTKQEHSTRPMYPSELDECAGPQPEDRVTFSYSEWEQIKPACDATEAEWTRTETKTTVSSVLVNHEWVDSEPVVSEPVVQREKRAIAKEDVVPCPITIIVENLGGLVVTGIDMTPIWYAGGLVGAGALAIFWPAIRRRIFA